MKGLWVFVIVNILAISKGRKNVLFIVMDDLRPQLGAYNGPYFPGSGQSLMHTPNIDGLASKSLLLKRAYVQQALCSPSRASFMTGRRPDTTHVYDLYTYFRSVGGNFTTIPQYFKSKGYETAGMGKIYHPGVASNNNDPLSWSMPYLRGDHNWEDKNHSWKGIPDSLLKDRPLIDKQIADHAINTLQHLAPAAKSGHKPFFLAVGFYRPHLPFVFPQSFIHNYPWSDVHVPDNQFAPRSMPTIAWTHSNELWSYQDIKDTNFTGDINTTLPHATVIKLRRAYYTSVSWVDSLIGNVLAELSRLGLDSNTVVSFVGDHGWKLGEHGAWAKHTNFNVDTHAPMMVKIPGMTDKGIVSEKLTEFVDLFPTLVEAAGVSPVPLCPENSATVSVCHEGQSLIPLIKNPNIAWKNASFSQYPRRHSHHDIMGYTITTDRYRYTEWVRFNKPTYKPDWNTVVDAELYDHQVDPNENINKVHYHSQSNIKMQLSQQLRAGWRDTLPSSAISHGFGR
ncbi:IDS [Mytilus edulis]|uniref:IDS n=1 Tax=Mytilus edulis TaxID=6550 RepID=A0A8S3S479_MYTED|nr:IDS [Mytilus edulis]